MGTILHVDPVNRVFDVPLVTFELHNPGTADLVQVLHDLDLLRHVRIPRMRSLWTGPYLLDDHALRHPGLAAITDRSFHLLTHVHDLPGPILFFP